MKTFSRWLGRHTDRKPDRPTDAPDPANLQRGEAAVSQSATAQGRLQRAVALLTIGGIGIGLLTWYYTAAYSKVEAARTASHRSTATKADADSNLPPIDFNKVRPPAIQTPEPEPPYRIGSILGDPGFTANQGDVSSNPRPEACCAPASNAKTPAQLREERLLAGSVFTRSPSAGAIPVDSVPAYPDDTSTSQTASVGDAPPASALSTLLQSSPLQLARATVLPTQRMLLPKGSFVDCTLETAIDSTLPGMATCLTAVDTFSADGRVVLLERGTKLIGETRGQVAHGASRLFVLWTEARTPQGIIVPLASPGTDELGRSGLPGKVDRHFMERFGAAILISVIDGAIQAAVANQTAPGSTVVNTGTTQDIMTEVLESTINIPPTLTKQQGDRIQILVARDLDFRSVYTLASRQR